MVKQRRESLKNCARPVLLGLGLLGGCTSIPPLVLTGGAAGDAPAGPKVASLVANLKCELWDAAHSTNRLTFYTNQPRPEIKNHITGGDSEFNLKNILSEIEYVGLATFTLDVTHFGGLGPSVGVSKYYRAAEGVLPATGAFLSVNGQLQEDAHRYLTINASIDFERLIGPQRKLAKDPGHCENGSELGGSLGLKEALATGLQVAAMNDIAIFPSNEPSASDTEIQGTNPVLSVDQGHIFGEISTQVDFTITEGISGGPNWILNYFAGPDKAGTGLLNVKRQVIDTLALTFIPICIREAYRPLNTTVPIQYSPPLIDGTPGWANYFPSCKPATKARDQVIAAGKARERNQFILLQNALRLQSVR